MGAGAEGIAGLFLFSEIMLKQLATRLRITKPAVSSTERLHLTLKPQQVLHDRYKVLSRLGQGQEATVWLAEEIAP